ncbi:peptidoglycan DD-metalloendopeptidase family protein [Ciceribacter sp. L1K22]|uniref:peptidoglycan DD-metalloendopeptidase family protein n=1 Tax=Ciceribacter sp. L1K22 TaxID=2820275 RepID=UPI001ABE82B0|nr:peptidoglycan DD-metalloendopeptidase family protein [Ciceribacter sp. L1K22]MBO3760069.1 peptidoglycan DD-metalloendopeptidase family protein [Ciceribacter sp. L1K22]
MRMSVSLKSGKSVARAVAAVLLAGAAAGCSSDASRFSGIFSQDTLTTASIRRGDAGLNGQAPVPSADVAGSSMPAAQQPDYSNRQQALSQPYPAQPSYGTIGTSSPARASIQRSELASPGVASAAPASTARQEALAQPFPAAPAASQTASANRPIVPPEDSITTGSNPTPAPQAVAARSAAEPASLPTAPKPMPKPAEEQKVAVLPTTPSSRDKQQSGSADPAKTVASNGASGGNTYTVKPGDSLAKISKETGTPIDALKSANGLTTATIRVGQTLKLPAGAASKTDDVKTASVPAKADAKPAPAAYQPPKESVSEVASIDTKETAPAATGIGKYRWPVTGAVVARYGQNVDGKRNDGIDISVPAGTAVKAAENGVVIYAGNGLKELGNTVLVRHDDGTVTVYGHADNLSVQRGQKVQRGQQIATSGMSGSATRPMLHFEVRKDATPVDPMTFLE